MPSEGKPASIPEQARLPVAFQRVGLSFFPLMHYMGKSEKVKLSKVATLDTYLTCMCDSLLLEWKEQLIIFIS